MRDLQLIGVHEDGEHLLLRGADDERFQMPVDDALRAAIRRDRPRLGRQQLEVDGGLRPRDVQALIRAGASTEEAASRAGWTVEKVHRFEGPILAEREHVAGLAQRARLRSPTSLSSGGSAPTLTARVAERLKSRDVEVTDASWDSWRSEGGPWTVVLTFAAGGRQRQASWSFDLADRTVSAVDDEARWLSEEVQEAKGPIPAPRLRPASGRQTAVYDVEAEGGLRPTSHDVPQDDPLDLMSAMRKRSTARGRRKSGGRSGGGGSAKAATSVPNPDQPAPGQPLPLDDLGHDAQGSEPQDSDAQVSGQEHSHLDQSHQEDSHQEDSPAMTPGEAEHGQSDQPDSEPAATLLEVAEEPVLVGDSADAAPHEKSPDDLTATSPHEQATSPHEQATSPHEQATAPHEQATAPHEQATRPQEGDTVAQPADKPAARQPKARPKRPVREASRKTGRPSVPAWDEIMFGSRSGGDRSSS